MSTEQRARITAVSTTQVAPNGTSAAGGVVVPWWVRLLGHGRLGLRVSADRGGATMTTTTTTAIVPFDPVFANPKRLALGGFLVGCSGPDPRRLRARSPPVRRLVRRSPARPRDVNFTPRSFHIRRARPSGVATLTTNRVSGSHRHRRRPVGRCLSSVARLRT
jgi:hypothetical protein